MKCKRDSDGRKLDHHTLQVMRQQAVKAVGAGRAVSSVAAAFGLHPRSVFRWLAAYADGGQNALLAKPIAGRPPKVTEEEMRWLEGAIREKTPQQYKFGFALWSLSLIGELLRRQFGKKLSLSAVRRIMKILGFTVQKPLYRAWQQDEVLVRRWEGETWPEIRKEAEQLGAAVYFADESGIRSDSHAGTTWAPCGETPVIEATGRRFSLNMISAVSPRGNFRFMVHEGSVTATVFREFLRRLMVGAEQAVFVVLDGHPIHKARLVRDYVEQQNGKLRLFFLPPYSPHLNPDEQVWAHVKRRVAKQLVQNHENMKELVISALRRIQKLPLLVKSLFQQPECAYIL